MMALIKIFQIISTTLYKSDNIKQNQKRINPKIDLQQSSNISSKPMRLAKIKEFSKQENSLNKNITNITHPQYVPLPFKSKLFKSVSFYAKQDKKNTSNKISIKNLFIKINTNNLGSIWTQIHSDQTSIMVCFLVENKIANDKINEFLNDIEENLKTAGYQKINLRCNLQCSIPYNENFPKENQNIKNWEA